MAMLIVGVSFWYSFNLVKNIAQDERAKVKLWANAIQEKAELVNYTARLFEQLGDEERKKAEIWVEATQTLTKSADVSFPLKVISSNTTIPIIWTDSEDNIAGYRNLEGQIDYLADTVKPWVADSIDAHNKPIVDSTFAFMKKYGYRMKIYYYRDQFQYFYYKDSRLFEEIRHTFQELQGSFISEVVQNSISAPTLYTNAAKDSVLAFGNIDPERFKSPKALAKLIKSMSAENEPIAIDIGDGQQHYIFYSDSELLIKIKYYPFVQMIVISLFILIGYWLFSTARKSEQNQVWVGMSKETAHQLGTPLSSLMGWIEVLKSMEVDESITSEMNKDILRLNTITDRFSKIGAKPNLTAHSVNESVEGFISYLKTRSPKKVNIYINNEDEQEKKAMLNLPLFGWVVENLVKNAIDAMEGKGEIVIDILRRDKNIYIDVSDTGKGIPQSKRKTVFEPGYTSKQRGWGLGLSLSKRIVENYHQGKIFVKDSELNVGTTFRIILKAI